MPSLILTDLGGGDLSYLLVTDAAWRLVMQLRRRHRLADPFLDDLNRLTESWLDPVQTHEVIAIGSFQRGVVEVVARQFKGHVIRHALYR
mgnify:CR=1 FL=1